MAQAPAKEDRGAAQRRSHSPQETVRSDEVSVSDRPFG